MGFPKIDVCLICEAARPELNNKTILIGFFGIAPYVHVLIPNFSIPVSLCFVFSGGGGPPGTYDIGLRLTDSQGNAVTNAQNAPEIKAGRFDAARPNTNIFMGFQGLLGKPGIYNVTLIIDGAEHFSTTVRIDPPPPAGRLIN
jgi:hypothetical protein